MRRHVEVHPRPFTVTGRKPLRRDVEGARLVSSFGLGAILLVVALATGYGGHKLASAPSLVSELSEDFSANGRVYTSLEGNATVDGNQSGAAVPSGTAAEGGEKKDIDATEEAMNHLGETLGLESSQTHPECPPKARLPNGKCPPKPHLFGGMGNMISAWMIILVLIPAAGLIVYFLTEVFWGIEGRMASYKLPEE